MGQAKVFWLNESWFEPTTICNRRARAQVVTMSAISSTAVNAGKFMRFLS